jgi:Type II secretion system (T2SS), protein E, N-terminal domain
VASLASRITQSLPSTLATLGLPVCANPGCLRPPTLWQRWWSRHEGIGLEGNWYCSAECFAAGLEPRMDALVRPAWRTHAPHQRFPLGLILLEQGVISPEQLQQALLCQRQAGQGRIGEWLVRNGAATEVDIDGALAVQQNCPIFTHSDAQTFPPRLQFPAPLMGRYGGAPLYFSASANSLYLGFAGPLNRSLMRAAEHLLGCRIEPCIVSGKLHRSAAQYWRTAGRGEAVSIEQRQSAREMARAIAGYADQAKASSCAMARCEDYLWTRLYGDAGSLDMLFRMPADEGLSWSGEEFYLPGLH